MRVRSDAKRRLSRNEESAREPAALRIVIECDASALPAAVKVATDELPNADRYMKLGWGWTFNQDGSRFFVRKTKTGLSCRQIHPKPGASS